MTTAELNILKLSYTFRMVCCHKRLTTTDKLVQKLLQDVVLQNKLFHDTKSKVIPLISYKRNEVIKIIERFYTA